MTIEDFVIQFYREIDSVIEGYGISGPFDNEEREAWVNKDETLYNWACQLGVEI